MRRYVAFVVFCLLILVSTSAWGQSQEDQAAALDQQAREAFSKGDFESAAQRFEEANRLVPHAQLLYNAALAWHKAGKRARAADGYEGALRQGGLDTERAGKARAALATLNQVLGTVNISNPLGGVFSVGHLQRTPIPAQFHLEPGSYQLSVERADGSKVHQALQVRAGKVVSVEIPVAVTSLGREATPPA